MLTSLASGCTVFFSWTHTLHIVYMPFRWMLYLPVICLLLQEDVIYALSESDAWSDILKRNAELNDEKGFRFNMPADPSKLAGRKDVIYLMKADDTPSDTMRYLRSVYCRQAALDMVIEYILGWLSRHMHLCICLCIWTLPLQCLLVIWYVVIRAAASTRPSRSHQHQGLWVHAGNKLDFAVSSASLHTENIPFLCVMRVCVLRQCLHAHSSLQAAGHWFYSVG